MPTPDPPTHPLLLRSRRSWLQGGICHARGMKVYCFFSCYRSGSPPSYYAAFLAQVLPSNLGHRWHEHMHAQCVTAETLDTPSMHPMPPSPPDPTLTSSAQSKPQAPPPASHDSLVSAIHNCPCCCHAIPSLSLCRLPCPFAHPLPFSLSLLPFLPALPPFRLCTP